MKYLKASLLKYSIQLSPDQWLGGECLGAYRQVRPLPPSSQFSFLHSWIGHLGNKGHAPACGRSGKDQTCWCQTSILAFVNSKGSQYLQYKRLLNATVYIWNWCHNLNFVCLRLCRTISLFAAVLYKCLRQCRTKTSATCCVTMILKKCCMFFDKCCCVLQFFLYTLFSSRISLPCPKTSNVQNWLCISWNLDSLIS